MRLGGAGRYPSLLVCNSIRQGSIISPHLFNVYIDSLSVNLSRAGIGCHIAGTVANHLVYADDLVVMAPSAKALNKLLGVCHEFALKNQIIFSAVKSVCMAISPRGINLDSMPKIKLGECELAYVDTFKYLGHYITSDFKDNMDIAREVRSLYCRGNTLVRKFNFLNHEIKCSLFRSYCYPLYAAALWCNFRVADLYRLKVAYNSIMRKISFLPQWESVRATFVNSAVRSFDENLRAISLSLLTRITSSENALLVVVNNSNSAVFSAQIHRMCEVLYVHLV